MTPPIISVLSDVREALNRARLVSLSLDFDGTLVPLDPNPEAPYLDAETLETLEQLSTRPHLRISLVSGRAVEDLYRRVRLEGLIYAGNHGLEIFGRGISFVEPNASLHREGLANLCRDLTQRLRPLAGTAVEYKGLTATVHYRHTDVTDLTELHEAVRAAVTRAGTSFRVQPGDRALEILPVSNWSKGAAVRWINQQLGADRVECIYIGDGSTDEQVFQLLPEAITIRIGSAPASSARHQLPDRDRVLQFLQWLGIQGTPRSLRTPAAS